MTQPPDFNIVAQRIVRAHLAPADRRSIVSDRLSAALADALRRTWNSRGAADISTIATQLAQQMGASASAPYVRDLDRALHALDR